MKNHNAPWYCVTGAQSCRGCPWSSDPDLFDGYCLSPNRREKMAMLHRRKEFDEIPTGGSGNTHTSQVWSNAAAIGYALKAASRAGLSYKQQAALARWMELGFVSSDGMTMDMAKAHYINFV